MPTSGHPQTDASMENPVVHTVHTILHGGKRNTSRCIGSSLHIEAIHLPKQKKEHLNNEKK